MPEMSQFASLDDALDVGVIVVDRDSAVERWNKWMANASGVAPEAALSRTLNDIFPASNLKRVNAAISDCLQSGTSHILTHALGATAFPLKSRAGRVLLHDVKVGLVSREPPRCVIQIFDVTIAAERERVLRDRLNARFDALVNSAADVIVTIDRDDAVCFVNPAAERHFGKPAKDLIGAPPQSLFDGEIDWRRLAASTNDPATHTPIEIVTHGRGGGKNYLEASISNWTDGENDYVTLILRDVSERRAAQELVAAREAQFKLLAQSLPNQVFVADADGSVEWVNDRFLEYMAPDTVDMPDFDWFARIHPDDRDLARSRWRTSLAEKAPFQAEVRLRRAQEVYRWHLVRAAPVGTAIPQETKWIGSSTDIDDQKASAEAIATINARLERSVAERTERLMAAEEALRQSQKMEAIGQLTGGIAHDFNNLLQGVLSPLERLRKLVDGARMGESLHLVDLASQSAERAATLTHRLLAFARRQPVQVKAVDLDALIEAMTVLMRRAVGENIKLAFRSSCGPNILRSDSSQLENVLLNLVLNARDAMPDGGQITIEATSLVIDAAEAKPLNIAQGEYVSLRVRDTGVGMSSDVIERVFEPFFTTKALGEGTGLGLSMVYGFAKQFNGAVRIDSKPGQGATVEVLLPKFAGELEAKSAAPDEKTVRRGGGDVILVVDDEVIIRLLIVDVLSELGYVVLEAGDGEEAKEVLKTSDRIDLLLTDVGLPRLNGRQLADLARVGRPNLPVLFMTGYAQDAVTQSFLGAGMQMLAKPFKNSALVQKVQEILSASNRSAPTPSPSAASDR